MTTEHNSQTCDCEMCKWSDRQEQEQLSESNLLQVVADDLAWVRLHRVRDAILDVLDARQWEFNVRDESDEESARRIDFAEAVVAQIQLSARTVLQDDAEEMRRLVEGRVK